MNYKKMFCTVLLSAVLSLQASAYKVTHVAEAPQWQVDWSYNQERPDWQEPDASDFVNFSVTLVTIEEALQPYASDADMLALFVGDELRGLATPALDMTAGTTDPTRFVLKAYGNESDGERIDATLKYYNAQLRQVFTRSATMMYDVEVVLGIDEPFSPAFTLGSAKYPVVNTIDVADMIAFAGITPADGDIAAAFVGDDCRGVAKFAAEADDNTQSAEFILHCSLANAGETVVFKYYDADHSCIITFDGTVTADANGDGTVDVADIATVISVMTGSASVSLATAADVNGDGTVDVADIATIISVMAKGQAQPATRPLTITVSETPFISPDASSAGARVGDYKSPLTSSVKRAAITTTSTLTGFNLDYTYGSSHGSATAAKANDGKWTSTGNWPDTDDDVNVNWYAHSDGSFLLTDDGNNTPYLSFTVKDEVANQKDLLVATAAGTYYGTDGNLSFTFDHACSALRFYMKKATNMSDYTLTVTSVILRNVVKTGDYYYDTSEWKPGNATTDYTDYTLFTGTATLSITDYTPMDTGGKPYAILIPQTLTAWDPTTALSNSYLELQCTIKNGTSSFSGTAYIPFAATLTQGYQHDVKVNIGKNSLYNKSGNKIIQP